MDMKLQGSTNGAILGSIQELYWELKWGKLKIKRTRVRKTVSVTDSHISRFENVCVASLCLFLSIAPDTMFPDTPTKDTINIPTPET